MTETLREYGDGRSVDVVKRRLRVSRPGGADSAPGGLDSALRNRADRHGEGVTDPGHRHLDSP